VAEIDALVWPLGDGSRPTAGTVQPAGIVLLEAEGPWGQYASQGEWDSAAQGLQAAAILVERVGFA
jgi:hypothetical protein